MNGETKNCFYLFQRLSLDYKPYIDVMFQWIKKDLEDKKKYRKMYNLLQEEYMYLVKNHSIQEFSFFRFHTVDLLALLANFTLN